MQPLLSVSHAWTMINPRFGLGQLPQDWFSMVVVSATHLQNMLVKLDRFHLVVYERPKAFAPFIHEAVVFFAFCNMFFAKSKTPKRLKKTQTTPCTHGMCPPSVTHLEGFQHLGFFVFPWLRTCEASMGHSATRLVSGEPLLCFLGDHKAVWQTCLVDVKILWTPKTRRPKLPPNVVTKKKHTRMTRIPSRPTKPPFHLRWLAYSKSSYGHQELWIRHLSTAENWRPVVLKKMIRIKGYQLLALTPCLMKWPRHWIAPIHQNIERHYNQPNLNILYLWYWSKSRRKSLNAWLH